MLRKELLDALRDRRTLLTLLLSSVAVGPLVLWLLSTVVAGIEAGEFTLESALATLDCLMREQPGAPAGDLA